MTKKTLYGDATELLDLNPKTSNPEISQIFTSISMLK
jgi:hypothetical protein